MKKMFITCAVLLAALMAQAQTKIAPKLENGFKAVYVEEATISTMGMPVKVTDETEYVVSDVTADGAIITATVSKAKVDADDSNPMAGILAATQQALEGVSLKFKVNADGQVLGVVNIDEVKANAEKAMSALLDKVYGDNPMLGQMIPRELMEAQLLKSLSEQELVADATKSGVLSLNGKTIANGATESYEGEQGMKMKRMYFVTGKNIIANSTLDMTADELKQMIIKQVEESAPEQAEMVKQNIDLVMGQMKFDVTAKTTYTLQDNGWVETIKEETNTEAMGQSSKKTSVTTLKK